MPVSSHWKIVLTILIPWVILEGAVRKWLLPGFQAEIYLLKDALLLYALFSFLTSKRELLAHLRQTQATKGLILLGGGYFSLQVANPNSPNILVGILGLKGYMLYSSLFFMYPHLIQREEQLDRALRYLTYLMIAICVLGLVQFTFPPTHWLNAYVVQDADAEIHISQFGGDRALARVTGTFSYIGGFATFVVASFNLAIARVLCRPRTRAGGWAPYILLILSTLAVFTTGSRWVILGTFGLLPLILVLSLTAGIITAGTFTRVCVTGGLVVAAVLSFGMEGVEATLYRVLNSDSNIGRAISPFTELVDAFNTSPVFGTGIGTNSNGSWVLAGVSSIYDAWWLNGHFYEVETARIMQEVGIVGFLLIYLVRISLVLSALTLTFKLRNRSYKALSAAICSFAVLHLGLFVVHNPTAGVFFWSASGLLFALYNIENTKRRPVRRPRFAPPAASKRYSL